jgi:hypothetical protein
MQLGNRVAAYFTWGTVVVRYSLSTLLNPSTDGSGLVIDFADNQDGADNPRSKTLEDDSLVVVDRNLRAVICELNGVRGWGRIIRLRWRRRRGVNTADRFVDINDVHDEGV